MTWESFLIQYSDIEIDILSKTFTNVDFIDIWLQRNIFFFWKLQQDYFRYRREHLTGIENETEFECRIKYRRD